MILILIHPVNDPFKYSGKLGYQALKPNWYFYCTNLQKLGTCKYPEIWRACSFYRPNLIKLKPSDEKPANFAGLMRSANFPPTTTTLSTYRTTTADVCGLEQGFKHSNLDYDV